MKSYPIALLCAFFWFSATSLVANKYDLNRDKQIDWEEFQTMKKAEARRAKREYNQQEIRFLFEDKDWDGNGTLSYQEVANHPYDLNSDKKISFDEFKSMHLKRASRNGREVQDAWIQTQFKRRDVNTKGYLTYQELSAPLPTPSK